MNYFLPFIIGFFAAFFGLMAPSMLNMTAARFSIDNGKKAGIEFSAGVVSVIFIQGLIAVNFARYLVANPDIIINLKTLAIFVLLALSIFFFIQARKKFKVSKKKKKGSRFFIGIGISSLNMLAIPFFLTIATIAENKGLMAIKQPFSSIYVVGVVIGAFLLFSLYSIFAEIIAKKAQFISQNMNYILSGLFLIFSIIAAIQVLK